MGPGHLARAHVIGERAPHHTRVDKPKVGPDGDAARTTVDRGAILPEAEIPGNSDIQHALRDSVCDYLVTVHCGRCPPSAWRVDVHPEVS